MDLILLAIVIVTVSIIIGFAIVTLIDKKINNIAVNIPPIVVPEQSITFDVGNKTSDGCFKICPKIKKNIEPFIVADAEDFHNYDSLKVKMFGESPVFNDGSQTGTYSTTKGKKSGSWNDELANPDRDRQYDADRMTPLGSGQEGSGGTLREGDDRKSTIIPKNPNMDCGSPEFWQDYDCQMVSVKNPINQFCGLISPDRIPLAMEDPTMRGYNYGDYSDKATPRQYIRLLSQATRGINPIDTEYKNIPVGSNYGFKGTPAMRMR